LSLVSLLFIYNGLVGYRNLADSALSTIDVMLKKRWDLIPNLVAAVKGYMQHEASLLERMATVRSTAVISPIQSGPRMDAESQLSSALGQFRITVENYPVLKANEKYKSKGSIDTVILRRGDAISRQLLAGAHKVFSSPIVIQIAMVPVAAS